MLLQRRPLGMVANEAGGAMADGAGCAGAAADT
jgi:hypothetical protein